MVWLTLKLLFLIFVANGAPILAARFFGKRYAVPVDRGGCWYDGNRFLGDAKTYRGLIASLLLTPLAAVLVGLSLKVGFVIACGAMAGDMISSLIKRRFGLKSSAKAIGLDQIPESLIPLLAVQTRFGLGYVQVLVAVVVFLVLGLLVSRVLYRWSIRTHPH